MYIFASSICCQKILTYNIWYALYNLSRIYYFGEGVEKNVNQSINYLKIAADKGLKPAILFLSFIFWHEDQTNLYTEIDHIMLEFFRQYDLVGTDFFLDEFIYFIKYGNLMSNKRFEVADQDKRRPIDSFFRDGFSLWYMNMHYNMNHILKFN